MARLAAGGHRPTPAGRWRRRSPNRRRTSKPDRPCVVVSGASARRVGHTAGAPYHCWCRGTPPARADRCRRASRPCGVRPGGWLVITIAAQLVLARPGDRLGLLAPPGMRTTRRVRPAGAIRGSYEMWARPPSGTAATRGRRGRHAHASRGWSWRRLRRPLGATGCDLRMRMLAMRAASPTSTRRHAPDQSTAEPVEAWVGGKVGKAAPPT